MAGVGTALSSLNEAFELRISLNSAIGNNVKEALSTWIPLVPFDELRRAFDKLTTNGINTLPFVVSPSPRRIKEFTHSPSGLSAKECRLTLCLRKQLLRLLDLGGDAFDFQDLDFRRESELGECGDAR